VERLTGTRATTCPWFAFSDPLVAATLHAYPFFESGQLDFVFGGSPPAVMVEAIECYHTALARVRDVQDREKQAARESDAAHAKAVKEMGSIYGRR
jgi:hypothetical protein